MNPYQVLKISPTASREEIRSAYRALARRWHPDRFTEGPERDWANEKMADINTAYQTILRGFGAITRHTEADEKDALKQIEKMIESGNLIAARKRLMTLSGRSAEWNYLLGTILLKMQEYKKAKIYLSIATHQQPKDVRYKQALKTAKDNDRGNVLNTFMKRFSR